MRRFEFSAAFVVLLSLAAGALLHIAVPADAAVWVPCTSVIYGQQYMSTNFYCCGQYNRCGYGATYFRDISSQTGWTNGWCQYTDSPDNVCRSSAFAADCTADFLCNGVLSGTVKDATTFLDCLVGNLWTRDMCSAVCQPSDTNTCDSGCDASVSPTCDGRPINTALTSCTQDTNRLDFCTGTCRLTSEKCSSTCGGYSGDAACNGYNPGDAGLCSSGHPCQSDCKCLPSGGGGGSCSSNSQCTSYQSGSNCYYSGVCSGSPLACSYQSCSLSSGCTGASRCGDASGDTLSTLGTCGASGCSFTQSACGCGASDSDSGQVFTTKGTCVDNTGCSASACQNTNYDDYCTNPTTLREYYVSGSGDAATCSYVDRDCTTMGAGYTCSAGACAATNPCNLMSASVTANCAGGASADCETGETIRMTGTYVGDCSAANFFQIDAASADGLCHVQYSGGQIIGISGPSPVVSGGAVIATWTVPAIPAACTSSTGKAVTAQASRLWQGLPGGGGWNDIAETVSGTFRFAAPTTVPTTTTPTTLPPTTCTWLRLTPSSGLPSYTVTAGMTLNTCRVCDSLGCSGVNCAGVQARIGNGTFAAPNIVGIFGYYACPGAGCAIIEVTNTPTTTTIPPTPTTIPPTPTTIPPTPTTIPPSFALGIEPGWNLISLPYSTVSSVQSDSCGATNGNFYFYNAAAGKWNVGTVGIANLKKATAYWFYSTSHCSVAVAGSGSVAQSDMVLSKNDWNDVGAPMGIMPVSDLASVNCWNCLSGTCSSIVAKYYDTISMSFKDAPAISAGVGYRIQCIGS